MLPVLLETAGQIAGHGADTQQVDVDEIAISVDIVIFIAEVSPAHDDQIAISQQQLVMHPPMLMRELKQATHRSRDGSFAALSRRVEHLHLDVGMGGAEQNAVIARIAGEVIEQQPDMHAAAGRL